MLRHGQRGQIWCTLGGQIRRDATPATVPVVPFESDQRCDRRQTGDYLAASIGKTAGRWGGNWYDDLR
jgi:hypothetical protein